MSMNRILALCAVALSSLALLVSLGRSQNTAVAAPNAATPTSMGDLGPADKLLLTASEGEPLSIVNREARIGWGDKATNRAWSIGAVHSDRVMRALMASPSIQEKVKELEEQAMATDAEFQKRAEDLQAKYKDVKPGDAGQQEGMQAFQALNAEYTAFRESKLKEVDQVRAGQTEDAYKQLVTAVDRVCEREQIDLVFRYIPVEVPFKAEGLQQVYSQIQLRTFVKHPAAVDITDAVIKELGVTEESPA
ncbi:MAG: OmpH family outer membrane protein [Planctomycetota bacterium]|nr:MAG: OmpH family outer membrane protein [Planctomycetota bacterium]